MSLTLKQQKAIAALVTERNMEDAAQKAGCSPRSIRSWIANNELFVLELDRTIAAILDEASRNIIAGSLEAIAVLREIMHDASEPAKVRVTAALGILSHLPKLRILNSIEERLTQLEADGDPIEALFFGR